LYLYQSLSAMEIVIKVLHCESEIIESETIMTFLADEKVSDNEAIVWSTSTLSKLEKCSDALSNGLVQQREGCHTSQSGEGSRRTVQK